MNDRSSPPDIPPPSSLANDLARGRTHLGNERTHLAYLRTTVSLIGFGITINRFSTYLIQNDQAPKGNRLMLHDASNAGFGMVLLGYSRDTCKNAPQNFIIRVKSVIYRIKMKRPE